MCVTKHSFFSDPEARCPLCCIVCCVENALTVLCFHGLSVVTLTEVICPDG